MNRVVAQVTDALESELWPIPSLAVGAAIGLGIGLPVLDAAIDDRLSPLVAQYLFGGGPAAARAVLQAVSGSLITVTSLTFSLTVVTLQLASSQFSPRLLRTFTSDRFVHGTLALFLATFTYALTVLRTVRTQDEGGAAFVPQLSVTFAYVLSLASVIALVMFLAHLTREIRVETMMQRVSAETSAVIKRLFDDEDADRPGSDTPVPLEPTAGSRRIESADSGFLTHTDERALLAAATAWEAVIRIDSEAGDSLIRRTPFATAWPLDPSRRFTSEEHDGISNAVNGAIGTGVERTNPQDAGYGFRQLADVAAKALSPGINDPTTAVHVIGHLSALLCLVAELRAGPRSISDENGRVRVVVSRPTMRDLLGLGLSQIRQYGAQDPVVASRILCLLKEVAWCDRANAHTVALRSELAQTTEAFQRHSYGAAERGRLDKLARQVSDALKS
ncbi:MAG: DUF2254 domain-containing protein [Cryobacterium sp.]